MPETEALLLARLCRRNWFLWCVLVVGSLLWRSPSVFFGVTAGGLMAIGGFYWLRWSLTQLLVTATPQHKTAGSYILTVLLRFLVLAGLLFFLIGFAKVSPLALVVGLSIVVLNLLGLALEGIVKGRIFIS